MKKYFAEMVGTMVLVLMGCGTAVSLNCGSDMASVVGTAMAFGLAVVAMAYTIGGISGCHINPAITLGCVLSGRMNAKDAGMYMLFQCIGAFIGSGILYILVQQLGSDPGVLATLGGGANHTGANACGNGAIAALIVEVVLTFVFVLVVLGTTDEKKGAGNLAGLAIGLSLILVHLVGIRYTGTSVNPARSLAPAIFEGGEALAQLWAFIVGPFIGGAAAAGVWKFIGSEEEK